VGCHQFAALTYYHQQVDSGLFDVTVAVAPHYLVAPGVPRLAASLLPAAKFVVVLRSPAQVRFPS
jgi:hypothetical protein